ncbi:MAG: ABC transporter substrate-binding protein [Ornithinimicrobium sp.]|uniref:ABC transporter substrate-binding protein n=1 Tax=Ornithinimicrobium sp. TaxID=1977084 RepID=UPI003D9B1A96
MSPQGGAPIRRRSLLRGATLLAVGGSATLAGCGDTSGGVSGASPAEKGETEGPGGITVTDQRGATISLVGPARRIVTLPMPAAALLVAVDQGAEHLVGMHDASWVAMKDGIMGEMFPDVLDIAHDIAGQDFAPNVESVVGLEPDLVIQWGEMGEEVITPLENAGLQVAGLTYGGQQELTAWITFFATVLGKPERGAEINTRMEQDLQTIRAFGEARRGGGPRILYFNRFAEGLTVAGNETYNDFYIDLVGGTNVASGDGGAPGSGMVEVDREQVLAWDPEIVLLGNFDDALPQDLYSDKVWAGLSAVRTRQVYKVPLGGYRWDPPSQESPLLWRWLSQLVFPDDSGDSSLRTDIVDQFDFLYGQQPTPAQIDTMLWSEANASSAHYEQFHAS